MLYYKNFSSYKWTIITIWCLFHYFFSKSHFWEKAWGLDKTFIKYLLNETHILPHFSFSKAKWKLHKFFEWHSTQVKPVIPSLFSYCRSIGWSLCNWKISREWVNPSGPDPGRREKIYLNFYFHTSFVVPQKILWRP